MSARRLKIVTSLKTLLKNEALQIKKRLVKRLSEKNEHICKDFVKKNVKLWLVPRPKTYFLKK